MTKNFLSRPQSLKLCSYVKRKYAASNLPVADFAAQATAHLQFLVTPSNIIGVLKDFGIKNNVVAAREQAAVAVAVAKPEPPPAETPEADFIMHRLARDNANIIELRQQVNTLLQEASRMATRHEEAEARIAALQEVVTRFVPRPNYGLGGLAIKTDGIRTVPL